MKILKFILASVFVLFVIQVLALIVFRVLVDHTSWALFLSKLEAHIVIIFTLPLASIFVFYISPGSHLIDKLHFVELKPIRLNVTLKWCFFTIFLWFINYFINNLFPMAEESFMIDSKLHVEDEISAVIILSSVCFVAPWVEELLFRGWLFKKLIFLNLNPNKVVLISALLFSSIHLQYNNLFTFLSVFSIGVFLGYVRLTTNNLSYSFLAHSTFNFISFMYLFV